MKKMNVIIVVAFLGCGMSHILHAMNYNTQIRREGMQRFGHTEGGYDQFQEAARRQENSQRTESLIAQSRLRNQASFWHGVQIKNHEIVRRALLLGADVDAVDNNGNTALLLLASELFDLNPNSNDKLNQVALELIKAGANVNANNSIRQGTPLMFALELGKAKLAKLLLDNGADVNIRLRSSSMLQGLTALDVANSKRDPNIRALIPIIEAKMSK